MSTTGINHWIRYRDTGLYAVPSIHHRQVFAQMVLESCRKKPFDVIAVELPQSLRKIVSRSLSLLPHPLLVINPVEDAAMILDVPSTADPHDKERIPHAVKRGVVLPVTICDSIVTALRCPALLQELHPGWEPEILFIDDEYCPRQRSDSLLPYRDDYEVIKGGLPTFIDRLGKSLESRRDSIVDDKREQIMSSRLREQLDLGKEILLVCGAAHWRRICRYLDQETTPCPEPNRALNVSNAMVIPIDPENAWLGGWLDDMPRLVWEFEASCGVHRSYDKLKALELINREAISRAGKVNQPPSIRDIAKMRTFCDRLAASAGCWIPKLDDHLAFAARSCVGEGFEEVTMEIAFTFPSAVPPGKKNAGVRPYRKNSWLVYCDHEIFLLEFPKGCNETSRRVRLKGREPSITEKEAVALDSDHGIIRDWPDDQKLVYEMDDAARSLADRNNGNHQDSRRSLGSIGGGPDLKRIIRARASGDNSIYIRQSRTGEEHDNINSRPVTPVVWIFDPHAKVFQRGGNLGYYTPNELAYTALTYVTKTECLFEKRIYRDRLAAMTDLGRSKAFLAKGKRPSVEDGRAEMKVDTKYLQSLPVDKLCLRPYAAPNDLEGYEFLCVSDQAIASGIRFAGGRIILVAPPALRISPVVTRYAKERGVEISHVSIQKFSKERIDRFRWCHWVPCPGRHGYEQPYDWLYRFIPPIN